MDERLYLAALNQGLRLFYLSGVHRSYTVQDVRDFLVLPILHDKARFHFDGGDVVGLVTWCWLMEDEVQPFLQCDFRPDENVYARQSGDQLWGLDFIAPFGHTFRVMRDIRHHFNYLYGPKVRVHWRRAARPQTVHSKIFL